MRFNSTPDVPRHARTIVWLRRDLRLRDNVALAAAAESSERVCVAFVLDPELLGSERMGAPLVQTFFSALGALRAELRERASDLALLEGDPAERLIALAARVGATAVCFNRDYEPEAIARDERVTRALEAAGLDVRSYLDHVCFEASEIVAQSGAPYTVFTPFARRWRDRYRVAPPLPVPSLELLAGKLLARERIGATRDVPEPEGYGFASSPDYPSASEAIAARLLDRFTEPGGGIEVYAARRDLPALDGTSHLSPQLRAGTIGIRTCFARAFAAREAQTWTTELIWREFYQTILVRFPHVATGPFQEAARGIAWRDDDAGFAAWCEGRTGFPIVDAAMRQLDRYGWMHNRLRMIVASFLTKDLLISWQRGERYFERHLADADLAQNNGGWQWAASTGTDAVPYFRIFNPTTQGERFDPDGAFARAMIPELGTPAYPAPIVDHAAARTRAIATFAAAVGKGARERL
ncbi:MAG TPA: deoxyribodipyrimidine photo-lyase [Candidatus Baltobacteraceae bacterium]